MGMCDLRQESSSSPSYLDLPKEALPLIHLFWRAHQGTVGGLAQGEALRFPYCCGRRIESYRRGHRGHRQTPQSRSPSALLECACLSTYQGILILFRRSCLNLPSSSTFSDTFPPQGPPDAGDSLALWKLTTLSPSPHWAGYLSLVSLVQRRRRAWESSVHLLPLELAINLAIELLHKCLPGEKPATSDCGADGDCRQKGHHWSVPFLYFLSGVDLDRNFEVEQKIKHVIKAFRTKIRWSKCLMLWVRRWNFPILTPKELHLLGVQHS